MWKWVEFVGLIATIAGLISSALYFFVATRGLDLVVWWEKVQRIYPSAEADDLALPLSFQNEPAGAVTLIKVNVSNLGNDAIGSQEHLWQLTISEPNASRLERVGTLEPSSDRISFQEMAQPTRNAFSVQLGVLEPRARLEFWLMAIHDPAVRLSPDVSTSLAGLPRPEKTPVPLSERLAASLLPFMIPLWALGFLLISVHDLRQSSTRLREAQAQFAKVHEQRLKQAREHEPMERQLIPDDDFSRLHGYVQQLEARDWRRSRGAIMGAIAAHGVGILLGAVMVGGISAEALGWVMAWFI